MSKFRLSKYEKYIHTNCCSDEGGWFAYPCPDGNATQSFDEMADAGLMVNNCETEEQAIQELVKLLVAQALRGNKGSGHQTAHPDLSPRP